MFVARGAETSRCLADDHVQVGGAPDKAGRGMPSVRETSAEDAVPVFYADAGELRSLRGLREARLFSLRDPLPFVAWLRRSLRAGSAKRLAA